jgi:predicted transposase YdaD
MLSVGLLLISKVVDKFSLARLKEEIRMLLQETPLFQSIKQEGKQEGILEGELKGELKGILKGKQEGILEGLQKGKQEGKREAAIETAKKMAGINMPLDVIAKCVEIPEDELRKLLYN